MIILHLLKKHQGATTTCQTFQNQNQLMGQAPQMALDLVHRKHATTVVISALIWWGNSTQKMQHTPDPYPTHKSRSIWAKNGNSDNKFPDHCLFIVQILLNIWDQTFTYQTKHVNDLFLFCYLLSTAATARQNQSTRRARWEIWWWERNIFFSKPGWQNELYRFLSVEIVRQWRVIPNSVGVRVRCWYLWFDFFQAKICFYYKYFFPSRRRWMLWGIERIFWDVRHF